MEEISTQEICTMFSTVRHPETLVVANYIVRWEHGFLAALDMQCTCLSQPQSSLI